MYLSEVNLWNFRKYGINGKEFEDAKPGLIVQFNPGLNVLIGENDSGKTAVIDAIRYVLGTQSREWIRPIRCQSPSPNIPVETLLVGVAFELF